MKGRLSDLALQIQQLLPGKVRRAASPIQPLYWKIVALGGERVVETPWGVRMNVNPSNRMEHRFGNGVYEEAVVSEIQTQFQGKNCHVADIGANVGYYSLLFDAILNGGHVDAFEPLPPIIHRLESNIEVNKTDDIQTYNCALSNLNGEIELTLPDDGNNGMATSADEQGETYTVPCRTLDDVYEGSPTPTVLKIDIEGAELELVQGGMETFDAAEFVILELHTSRLDRSEVTELFDRLVSTGFSVAKTIESGSKFGLPSLASEDSQIISAISGSSRVDPSNHMMRF